MQKSFSDFMSSLAGKVRGGTGNETKEGRSPEDLLKDHLSVLAEVQQPPQVTLEEFIKSSENFPISFPVDTAKVATLQKAGHDKTKLEEQVNSAYPLLHERVMPLLAAFLQHKRVHGRKKERKLYQNLDLLGLVDRLLKKRPVMFVNCYDRYYLWDKTEGVGGFEKIGSNSEQSGLTLADYMSYDEIKLSALMCVSSQSVFINDGNRQNQGIPGPPGTFQPEGVIVGMVGARMHRKDVMEWQDCVITPEQNTKAKGYGKDPPRLHGLVKAWGRLWGSELPTWDQAQAAPEGTFLTISPQITFNTEVYKARIQLSAETLLAEAGTRAQAAGMQAYVHVVGLGLGVWHFYPKQELLYVDAWGDALKASDTSHIAHVDFSWIKVDNCQSVKEGEVFPNTNVTLHFSHRALHAPVPSGTLLVVSFAWDGNSLPGNEYWLGSLISSGDPSAACSSGVAELHNALINPCVTAANLHVASPNGIEHVSVYAQRKLQQETIPVSVDI